MKKTLSIIAIVFICSPLIGTSSTFEELMCGQKSFYCSGPPDGEYCGELVYGCDGEGFSIIPVGFCVPNICGKCGTSGPDDCIIP